MLFKRSNASLWARIKKRALDLFIAKQITRKHLRLILEADTKDEKYIGFLMSLTEDLMRIKGYYNNNARIEACDNAIDNALAEYIKEVNG